MLSRHGHVLEQNDRRHTITHQKAKFVPSHSPPAWHPGSNCLLPKRGGGGNSIPTSNPAAWIAVTGAAVVYHQPPCQAAMCRQPVRAVIRMILFFRPQCTPPSLALDQPSTLEATVTHPKEHSSTGNQRARGSVGVRGCTSIRVCCQIGIT